MLKHFFLIRRNRQIIFISASFLLIMIAWLILRPKDPTANLLKVPVKEGYFEISITTTGELEAKNSEHIKAPDLRKMGFHSIKIQHIVPNGTIVKEGDYVASMNRSGLMNKITEMESEIDKLEAKYVSTQLDTTINLKSARNELLNQEFGLEEIEIELKQSEYEPPSTIRQVKIKLDKAKRAYDQKKASYKLKVDKAKASMREVTEQLNKAKKRLSDMREALSKLTIYATKGGMVVHPRGYGQNKNIIGREIFMHHPVVATLPNLQHLISKTYVNELDISKVKKGQMVSISIDAFPNLEFEGIVTDVANMGNQYMSGNAKLFEVSVELENVDNVLKPSMTTKNKIITKTFENVKYVPLECIHNDENGSYVFSNGHRKQVIVGETNANEIIILEGLDKDDEVCLSSPKEPKKLRFIALAPEIIKKHEDLRKQKKQIKLSNKDQIKKANGSTIKQFQMTKGGVIKIDGKTIKFPKGKISAETFKVKSESKKKTN